MMLSVVVVALSFAQPAAQPKKAGWVALVRTEAGVPASWAGELRNAAEENKGITWAEPPAVTLDEAQLALGCPSFNAGCAGQIAGMTGATHAFVVEVSPAGEGGRIAVELVRANGKADRERVTVDLPDLGPDGLAWAREIVRGATRNKVPALLVVETDAAAEVHIDGSNAGTAAPGAPLKVTLEAGDHRVNILGPGAPVVVAVSAKPGEILRQTHSVTAQTAPPVDATPAGAPGPKDKVVTTTVQQPPPDPASARTVGWSLAGVGGALAVVGGGIYAMSFHTFYLARVPCGPEGRNQCAPTGIMLGMYDNKDREAFYFRDATVWLSSSAAAVGIGAILIGAGTYVALSE